MSISHETRAERASIALTAYIDSAPRAVQSDRDSMVDLIADLVHLAANMGPDDGEPPDPLRVLATARMHYEAETESPEG